MATVMAQVVGGDIRALQDVETLGDVRTALGLPATYSALINKKPATDDTQLEDGNFVTFAAQTKGA